MTTVFLSGSRKISRINDRIRERLRNMVNRNFRIIIGDANGADKALQGFLAEIDYQNVVIFCAGEHCRNNIGEWETKNVDVPSTYKGRDFYTQKDKEMALEADYGLVIWDGKSSGSINNVFELLKGGKKTVVYLYPKKEFIVVKEPEQLEALLKSCSRTDYEIISKKTNLNRRMRDLQAAQQETLNL